jgi:hypothetical protein
MGLLDEIKKTLKVAGEQFTSTSTTNKGMRFTSNFQAKAKSWGLTEKDAEDVYHHGQEVKQNMLVRKYNGYEIGIDYFLDKRSGQPVITSIWKRDRR